MSKITKYLSLIILSIGGGTIYLVPYFSGTYYTQLANTGLTNTQIGTFVSIYGGVSLLFYIPSGIIADKLSVRKLYTFSMISTGLLALWYSTLPGYKTLLVIYTLMSITTVLTFWSAYLKGIRLLGEDDEQGKMYGISDAIRGISGLLTSSLALVIINMKLFESTGVSGGMVFFGLLYIGVGILSFVLLKDNKKDTSVKSEEEKVDKINPLKLFAKKETWIISIYILLVYTTFRTLSYSTPFYTQVLGISESMASTIAIVRIYLMGSIAAVIAGNFADRKKPSVVMLFCGIAYVIFNIILLVVMNNTSFAYLTVAMTLVLVVLISSARGVYYATLTEVHIPAHVTGVATGLISLVAYSSDIFLGPLVGGWLDNNTPEVGFRYTFTFMLVLAFLSIVFAFIINKVGKANKENGGVKL